MNQVLKIVKGTGFIKSVTYLSSWGYKGGCA